MNFFDTTVTEYAKQKVMECLDSGMLSEGKLVREFEQAIENKFGYKNCVAVNSGTSALHTALFLAGVRQGDEVVIPAQTFIATGLAVQYFMAIPVFVDIDKRTGNMSHDDLARKINGKTRAAIFVSWGGNTSGLKEVVEICNDLNVTLIQDDAQSLGVPSLGKFSCYSFQAIKHLTTGDGGMVSCKTSQDTETAKRFRWFGIDRDKDLPDSTGERRYNLTLGGFKYHMNDYEAALGLGNLDGFDERQKIRNSIAERYDNELPKEIQTVRYESANWLYTVLVERRSAFMRRMKEKDIPVSVVHVGIDRNDIFGGLQNLPNQRYWDRHHVCLPVHPNLTEQDVSKVIEAVKGGW